MLGEISCFADGFQSRFGNFMNGGNYSSITKAIAEIGAFAHSWDLHLGRGL